MTVLLIRFGLIVGGLVLLALVAFTVAVVLKRRGTLGDAQRRAAPLVHHAARYLEARGERGNRRWIGVAVRAVDRHLDDRHSGAQDQRDSR